MSKRRKVRKSHAGLWVTLGIVGAVVITGGVLAIVTKGFKEFGPAEKFVKGGVTVLKLDAVKFDADNNIITFKDANEDYSLNAIVDLGYQSEDEEHIYLGDKDAEPALANTELETSMKGLGLSNKTVADILDYTTALDVAKSSVMTLDLDVDYAKTKPTGFKEVEYFDAVRVNYRIDAKRAIITDNVNDEEHKAAFVKRSNNVTDLYENIDLYELDKDNEDDTLSENRINFYTLSEAADKDNSVEILSIELIRTGNANSDNKCYFAQL